MVTKEKLIKEIDKIPKEKYAEVYKLLNTVNKQRKPKRKINIKSYNLGGYFDNKNVREFAYGDNYNGEDNS